MVQTFKSAIWIYFEILENDKVKALWDVCKKKGSCIVISRGGQNCKQFTTTNLDKHPKEFLVLSADEMEKKATKEKRTQSAELATTTRKKVKTQMTLQQSVEAGQVWEMDSPQA